MKNSFKPHGYNSVSPYFIVDDIQRFVDVVTQVFQGTELRKFLRPDGAVMHMEMRIDDSVIMIAEATDQFKAMALMIHVYVADADAAYAKALQLGCTSLGAPQQTEGDSDRRGGFQDFGGNQWYVSTQVKA